ncbi:VOC family protein [Maricaulaceae bacterium EIL42A08]|nr:VOC family protein [Maricaulaceae bacterium EIL42A08]
MEYLHTMVRISDIDASLQFYCEGLGLREVRRVDNEKGRFTLIFLATADDLARAELTADFEGPLPTGLPMIELTYNWDPEEYSGGRNFGHMAYRVQDIYALCARLQGMGYTIHRPPRDGRMAFVKSPDGISIELLQDGEPLDAAEPWASMENEGSW